MPTKLTVPAAAPGPVPSVSANRVTALAPVSAVITLFAITLLPARRLMEPPPLAVMMSTLMSRPALMSTTAPPAVAVIVAVAVISLPAIRTIPALIVLAVIAALIKTSLPASSVKVCEVVQTTASETVMLLVA